jgi:hypothetical protein
MLIEDNFSDENRVKRIFKIESNPEKHNEIFQKIKEEAKLWRQNVRRTNNQIFNQENV